MPRPWLDIIHGNGPLVVSIPHTGLDLDGLDHRLVSLWQARRDADWYIERLYDFARDMDATIIRTAISRTVIDVNRDPSGVSLYPGQSTTELCPTTNFDGEPLYLSGQEPKAEEINHRRGLYFDPYHDALIKEITRLRRRYKHIVVYDCHSIRSIIPRLFEGTLPHFNIGTNSGASCAPELAAGIEAICKHTSYSVVSNGRFKGGYITRSLGCPDEGIHAVQMELACRGYLNEPLSNINEHNWPPPYDPEYAAPLRSVLKHILEYAIQFTSEYQA